MSELKRELSTALQRLVEAMNRLNEDELIKMLDDTYSIEIKLVRKRNKDEVPAATVDIDITAIIHRLTNFPTREDAQAFLNESFGSRKLLEPIARSLDIPIMKQDKIDMLRDKVIEATVGARIRSQAIQGGDA